MTVLSQDLSKLTYPQLKSARTQIDEAMSARQRETAQKIARVAADTDIRLDELKALARPATPPTAKPTNGVHTRKPAAQAAKPKAKKTAPKAGEAKFRDPENPKLTWSGRGPRPRWMVARIESGMTVDALRV